MTAFICPATRQPLVRATFEQLAALHAAHEAGTLQNGAGEKPEAFEAAYVTADGQVAYPVRGGIPVLLAGEGMPTSPA